MNVTIRNMMARGYRWGRPGERPVPAEAGLRLAAPEAPQTDPRGIGKEPLRRVVDLWSRLVGQAGPRLVLLGRGVSASFHGAV